MPTMNDLVGKDLQKISASALKSGAENFYQQQQKKLEFQQKLAEKKKQKKKKR